MNSKPSKFSQKIRLLRSLHRNLESQSSKRELEKEFRTDVKSLVREDEQKNKEMVNLQKELNVLDHGEKIKSSGKKNGESGVEEKQRPFKCVDCDKSYMWKRHLTAHMKLHSGEGLFICEECGKPFVCLIELKRHIRVHTREKPFQCQQCKVSFSIASYLKVHARVHTEERPYKCKICEASFTQSCALNRHSRIHTGEKPYKCEVCDMCFTQRCSLNRHLRKIHEDKVQ